MTSRAYRYAQKNAPRVRAIFEEIIGDPDENEDALDLFCATSSLFSMDDDALRRLAMACKVRAVTGTELASGLSRHDPR